MGSQRLKSGSQRGTPSVLSPAKLNLILRVGPLESSGFHRIASLMTRLRWGDEIDFHFAPSAKTRIEIECDRQDLNHHDNLAVRAAMRFSEVFKISFHLSIRLNKWIPSEAGLGGGSSNAASVLHFLKDQVMKREGSPSFDEDRWQSLALTLGSDVPFFLGSSDSAWCIGRGEILSPIKIPEYEVVLVFPKTRISTPWAYRSLDNLRGQQKQFFEEKKPDSWSDSKGFIQFLENDFEALALKNFEELGRLRADILSTGALKAQMTGSGSCFFGLYETPEAADHAAVELMKKDWNCQRSSLGER